MAIDAVEAVAAASGEAIGALDGDAPLLAAGRNVAPDERSSSSVALVGHFHGGAGTSHAVSV